MSADEELVEAIRGGDQQAAAALIERYQHMVAGLAWRMLGAGEEARDAVQETFLNVLEALPGFRGECSPSTWVYRIAVTTCMARSRLRQRRRTREVSCADATLEAASPVPSSQEALEEREALVLLRSAIDELAEGYRAVIVLHYLQGLSYEQVSEILQVPLGTVKVRLFRARRLLQQHLEKQSKER